MKPRAFAAWLSALIFVASLGAQSSGVRFDLDKPAAPAPKPTDEARKKADEAKKKAEDAKKKKDDAMGKIEGIEIPHGKGFMGLQIVGGTFKLSFYDEKKKPTAPDVTRAALRWEVKYQPTPERTVLNSDGGTALVSAKTVRPPYSFNLIITLIKGEGDDAASETITVPFHQ